MAWFKTPYNVKPENENIFKATQTAYIISFVGHILAPLNFAYFGIYEMVLFNVIFSFPCWAFVLIYNRLGKHNLAFALAAIEIISHQMLGIYYIGWEQGLQYYFFYLAGLVFFNPSMQKYVKYAVLFIILACFIISYIFLSEGIYRFSESVITYAQILNVSYSIIPLAFVISYYAKSNLNTTGQLRELNTFLSSKNKELMELNATKNAIFRVISHDLRLPIHQMIQFFELMDSKMEGFSEEKKQRFIDTMKVSSVQSVNLLDNLLLWASSQIDQLEFNLGTISLYNVAEDNIRLLSNSAESKNVQLKNNIRKDQLIQADKNMISIVFRNLISNAIKFTENGGKVKIASAKSEDMLDIVVEDNGIGIPPAILDNLFQIESNTQRDGTNNEKGTGIGLILCKEFIDRHDGQLSVQSDVGIGSRFVVSLPV